MDRWPRISIVTPSFNQANYIVDTIESVRDQDYPNLEHIVIDGASTDGTRDLLRRYPHLIVVSEPDRGHADAVNKGFRLATGDIWGFLNSDDTLLPGALRRVAREVDPGRDRHVVMGRCRFIDERGRFIGIEHPSHFESHRRVLEVWKGHAIPQPAVFWTPQVWKIAGSMDETLKTPWIDYDLFCRFSRYYRFHAIDEVLAAYRLHGESKTERWTEAERLEESIGLSRRYWGSPLHPKYWRLALSLALFRWNRVGRGRRHLRQTEDLARHGRAGRAALHGLAGAILAPEVAFYVGVYPALRGRARGVLKGVLDRLGRLGGVAPETRVYLGRTEAWADGWVGPRLMVTRETGHDARAVALEGWADLTYMSKALDLTVRVDDHVIGRHRIGQGGDFVARIALADSLPPGLHTVQVEASAWFVPDRFTRSGDFRPLAWRMGTVELEAAASNP